ncbi:MAG: PIN-like domain-containing protein [Halarsenatibacteraceae bacterium]
MMKEEFSEFYYPTESELEKLWQEGIFIFDTNILLSLYNLSEETSNRILDIFDDLNDRIWLPYNVVYEYHQNRLNVIMSVYNETENLKTDLIKGFTNYIQSKLVDNREEYNPVFDWGEIEDMILKMKSDFNDYIEAETDKLPARFKEDDIRSRYSKIFTDRIGNKLTEKDLEEIYQEGEIRYEKGLSPGYKDKNKKSRLDYNFDDNRKYGDLIIWKQILKKAETTEKPIIFITDETKGDWWQQAGGLNFGPTYFMKKEMEERKTLFHMYSSLDFFRGLKNYLDIKIKENQLEAIKNNAVSELDLDELKVELDLKAEKYTEDELELFKAKISNRLNKLQRKKNYRLNSISSMQSEIDKLESTKDIIDRLYNK